MAEIDWTKSMQQTFEFYKVDPTTWFDMDKLENIESATVSRDLETETLGSCTLDGENINGEFYVRIYLIAIQNQRRFRIALGTFLIQTVSLAFDGKRHTNSVSAYTPLLELKETYPPIGYYIPYDQDMLPMILHLGRENSRLRFPQEDIVNENLMLQGNTKGFVADLGDHWLTFLSELASSLDYRFDLDPYGQAFLVPKEKIESMQPVWTYTDDNSSILEAPVSMDRDLYGIPNVVEVLYSVSVGTEAGDWKDNQYLAIAENTDPNSPTSIPSRGRRIVYRTNAPSNYRYNKTQLDLYARQVLEDLSSIECTLKYTHGYCPVRIGDCVRFNYQRAGYHNVKALVTKQSIKCTPGCPVTETAVFTSNLWKG